MYKIQNNLLLMGARNSRASQSSLHSEINALIWGMECIRNLRQFTVIFERIVFSWWRWFRKQKNGCTLQVTQKTYISWREVSTAQISFIYHIRIIQGRTSCMQRKKAIVVCCLYGYGATSLVCRMYMILFMLPTKKILLLQLFNPKWK